MMKVSVVTDELSADLETALELCQSWGVDGVELRGIGELRYPEVSDYWRLRVPELVKESGLQVAAISSGLFFIPYPPATTPISGIDIFDARRLKADEAARRLIEHHINELLPATIEAALKLGTRTLVCFSFSRTDTRVPPPLPTDEMIQVLRHAAEKVGAAGLQLAMEVDHMALGHMSSSAVDIIKRVDHPALGINWDLGNAYAAGEDVPYPDGYANVRPYVRHVHFKDAKTDPATGRRPWAMDDGVIDWAGQISALMKDGYEGFVSVEHHMRPMVENTRRTIERIRRHMAQALESLRVAPATVS